MLKNKLKVLHIISGLSTGGAEMMLYKIINENAFENCVVVLGKKEETKVYNLIHELGINIYFLNLKSNVFNFLKLKNIIKKENPTAIQAWMYYSNLISCLSILFNKKTPIFWNVRHSIHDIKKEKRATAIIIKICSLLSTIPKKIIYNSTTSMRQHESLGHKKKSSIYIANGFDPNTYNNSEAKKTTCRSLFNISNHAFVIGMIARYHPMKGHNVFIEAAIKALEHNSNFIFVCSGKDIDTNSELSKKIEAYKKNFILLGDQSSTDKIISCLDVLVSSSLWGEGFSNVIGESLLSEVLCIASDVGDSKKIVGQYGKTIQANNVNMLSDAILSQYKMDKARRDSLSRAARQYMIDNYSISHITSQYKNLYEAYRI